MNKKILYLKDSILIAILIFIDQFTKYLAVKNLKSQPSIPIIEDVLELDYLENHGVAFGMLQNQRFFILLTGFIFISIIIYIMIKTPIGKKYTILHMVLSFIIAGGIGNMIDRFRLEYVIDFISFVLIDFPIFNVADCYVVCGTVVLFILFIFVMKEEDFAFLSFRKTKEK